MKLKGLSKIAIAGAALAATAATLGTSTYAWYVSNDKVSMTGVQGTTAGDDVGANLVISGNKIVESKDTPASWGPSVQLVKVDAASSLATTDSAYLSAPLYPQSKAREANADKGVAVGDWINNEGTKMDGTSAALTTTFIEFKVWIKNSKQSNIKPELGIAHNASEVLKTQTAYNPNGLPTKKAGADTAVQSDDSFTVDAINALRLELTMETEGTDSTYLTPDVKTYDVKSIAKTTNLEEPYTTDATKFATGGDANIYYKNMKGVAAANTNTTTGASTNETGLQTSWENFSVKADEAVKLTFKIWLEGADADCFDSCISQIFDFNLKFTAVSGS